MATLETLIQRSRKRAKRDRHWYNRQLYRYILREIRKGIERNRCGLFYISDTEYEYMPTFRRTMSFRYERQEMAAALRLYCLRHPGAQFDGVTLQVDITGCPARSNPLKP